MTKELNTHQQAITANLEVLNNALKEASKVTEASLLAARKGEQNQAIGELVSAEANIKIAESLYNAIIAVHRANPQNL